LSHHNLLYAISQTKSAILNQIVENESFDGAFGIAISQTKNVILNQIAENEPFENFVFKKLRFENVEK
jgi:hypothetical protein